MKRILASILVAAGASIAFAAFAGDAGVPAAGRGQPTAAVARGAQAADARSAAVELAEGEVRWVDSSAGKLTVMHDQHRSLGMPPMTMVVRVKDAGLLTRLRVGDKIRFSAERANGVLTATVLQPEK